MVIQGAKMVEMDFQLENLLLNVKSSSIYSFSIFWWLEEKQQTVDIPNLKL